MCCRNADNVHWLGYTFTHSRITIVLLLCRLRPLNGNHFRYVTDERIDWMSVKIFFTASLVYGRDRNDNNVVVLWRKYLRVYGILHTKMHKPIVMLTKLKAWRKPWLTCSFKMSYDVVHVIFSRFQTWQHMNGPIIDTLKTIFCCFWLFHIFMPCNVILYFSLPYLHVSNCALLST